MGFIINYKFLLKTLILLVFLIIIITVKNNFGDNASNYNCSNKNNCMKGMNNMDTINFINESSQLLDLDNFKYIINPKCCDPLLNCKENIIDENLKYVWIITSYAGDVSKRRLLRQAYPNEKIQKLGVRRIFLLGLLNLGEEKRSQIIQPAIENEATRFQDILQGNFIEAYRNLTYKHVMGLKWAVENCGRHYKYIMKMDDDIVVNIYEVLKKIEDSKRNKMDYLMMGYVMNHMKPVRNKVNKWFVTQEEFNENEYPKFLSGWFYVIDIFTALKLLFQSKRLKYFWIDDVFVTGILRHNAGLTEFYNIQQYFTTDFRFLECCLQKEEALKKYKCDFIIGPDGNDPTILQRFQTYSESCYKQKNCIDRPKSKLLKKKCILDYHVQLHSKGNPKIEIL